MPGFSAQKNNYTKELIAPSSNRCENLFDVEHLKKVDEVIGFANSKFRRRNWSENFLAERYEVARKFDDTSENYVIRDTRTNEIVATLAVTFAVGDQEVPMEGTLNSTVPRPSNHTKKDLIIELRTFAIEHSVHAEVYPQIISMLFQNLFFKLAEYPELYNKPVLYTYADELSLRLYGIMGFKKLSRKKIVHAGSNWWKMVTTPKRLEKLYSRVKQPDFLSGFNQSIDFNLINDRPAVLTKGSFVLNPLILEEANSEYSQIVGSLNSKTEVEEGLWAAKKSSVAWYTNRKLAYISKLAQDTQVENFVIAANSRLVWNPEGQLVTIGKLAEPAILDRGIKAAKGAGVEWYTNRQLRRVTRIENTTQIENGIWAAKDSSLEWDLPGGQLSYISKLAADTLIDPTRGLIAAKGSSVRWIYDWKTQKIRISEVSKIKSECEVLPGIWAAPDSHVIFNLDAGKSPTVSILAKPIRTQERSYSAGEFLPFGQPL